MAFIDYYKIMGITKDTPQSQIRAAYKKRAKQFHPDLHPDDSKAKAKFQALNEAYEVLNDVEKRKKYDQYGENWKAAEINQGNPFSGQSYGQGNPFDGFDFSSFSSNSRGSSFFEDLFGGGTFKHRQRNEPDSNSYNMNATVNVDVFTALLGGEIILQTQNDKIKLKIKSCTQNGSKARLRGKGYSKGNGTYGDLIITYNVKIPDHLTERQKELLSQAKLQ